jgi:carotenoid cleavage dioxygenase
MHRFPDEAAGLPFSAHPRLGPDGTIWNFGYASGARRLILWRLHPDGRLHRVRTLAVEHTGMPHDFVVTRRHLVLFLAPLHHEPGADADTFLDAHAWHPERPTRVLVMDLEDLSTHRWLELPAQWVFHFGNAFEEADGTIRVDGASAPDPSFLFGGARDLMRGAAGERTSPARPTLWRLDPRRGRADQTMLAEDGLASEFPVVDPRRATRRHRWVTTLTERADDPAVHRSHTTVSRLDLETGAVVGYRYPDDEIPEEHRFVPDPTREDEDAGWLVGTSVDWHAGATHLNVLRADAVADGPVARATLPRVLPLGLHGVFGGRA